MSVIFCSLVAVIGPQESLKRFIGSVPADDPEGNWVLVMPSSPEPDEEFDRIIAYNMHISQFKRTDQESMSIFVFDHTCIDPSHCVQTAAVNNPDLTLFFRGWSERTLESNDRIYKNTEVLFEECRLTSYKKGKQLSGGVFLAGYNDPDDIEKLRTYVDRSGNRKEAIPSGTEELSGTEPMECCRECGAVVPDYHVVDCPLEQCPFCGKALKTCGCVPIPLAEMGEIERRATKLCSFENEEQHQ